MSPETHFERPSWKLWWEKRIKMTQRGRNAHFTDHIKGGESNWIKIGKNKSWEVIIRSNRFFFYVWSPCQVAFSLSHESWWFLLVALRKHTQVGGNKHSKVVLWRNWTYFHRHTPPDWLFPVLHSWLARLKMYIRGHYGLWSTSVSMGLFVPNNKTWNI